MHGRCIKDYLLYEQFISAMMLEPRAVHISILWAKICNPHGRRGRVGLLISPLVHRQFSEALFYLLGFSSDRNQGHRWAFTGTNALLPWQHTVAISRLKDPLLQMSQGSHSTIYPTFPRRASHLGSKPHSTDLSVASTYY